jgi:Mrp family chromosome partitioning ATPase/capsular polysaccharide biosynthesis protein
MDLERFRRVILTYWGFIAVCILLAGLGAVVGTQFLPKLYQGQAQVQVDVPATDVSLVLGVPAVITTQVQNATSLPILGKVAAQYPGMTAAQLSSETSAAAFTGSHLFTITVLDASPTRAAYLANDIARALIQTQRDEQIATNADAQKPLQQAIADIQTQLNDATTRLATLQAQKADSAKVADAQVNVENLQGQLTQSQLALSQLQASQANKATFMHLAGPATPSSTPKRPYLLLNVGLGLGLGVVLGLLLVVLFDLSNRRLRSPSDLLDLVDWPVLADFSDSISDERSGLESGAQTLAQNLAFLDVERPLRSLCVVGAGPQDKADVIAAQLALRLASQEKWTLLVDADLAHPTQGERFGIVASSGLSTAIVDSNATSADPVSVGRYMFAPTSIQAPKLAVIPGGPPPPNPANLLKSRALPGVMRALATSGASVTIVSGPPLIGSEGAIALARSTDGAIVVIGLSQANRQELLRLKAHLAKADVAVLGCVVWSSHLRGNPQRDAGEARPQSYRAPGVTGYRTG